MQQASRGQNESPASPEGLRIQQQQFLKIITKLVKLPAFSVRSPCLQVSVLVYSPRTVASSLPQLGA